MRSSQQLWTCIFVSAIIHGLILLPTLTGSTGVAKRLNAPAGRITAILSKGQGTVAIKPREAAEHSPHPESDPITDSEAAKGWPSLLPPVTTPEIVYFPPEDVEEKASAPDVPDDMALPSPELASGHLVIKLFISQNGIPDRVEILESTLPETYTDRLIEQIMALTFIPAKKSGTTVASWKLMELIYESGPSQ